MPMDLTVEIRNLVRCVSASAFQIAMAWYQWVRLPCDWNRTAEDEDRQWLKAFETREFGRRAFPRWDLVLSIFFSRCVLRQSSSPVRLFSSKRAPHSKKTSPLHPRCPACKVAASGLQIPVQMSHQTHPLQQMIVPHHVGSLNTSRKQKQLILLQ